MAIRRPRLLFLVTEDWYFWSHRVDLARVAQDEGFEVLVATRVRNHGERIRRAGFRLVPLRTLRRGAPGARDMAAVAEILCLYWRARPDIVHHVALKPVVYGSWAARLARVPGVVNAIAGLGSAFIGNSTGSPPLHVAARHSLRFAFAVLRSTAIFQNHDDWEYFTRTGILGKSRAVVIRGSGVNTNLFMVSPEPAGVPLVLLPARMLWDKGVGEFVEAARILSAQRIHARCVLVGMIDAENPSAIPEARIRAWQHEGVVEWWGHREDMPRTLAAANVIVLPTYREGLPKVLLEASASGRVIVATDVPGCREIVRHGVNGSLVPPHDPRALAEAITLLVRNPALRAEAGRRGREIVEREFSVARIAGETLAVYRRLLDESGARVDACRVPEART